MTPAPRQAALASQTQSWLMHEASCMLMVMLCKETFGLVVLGAARQGR